MTAAAEGSPDKRYTEALFTGVPPDVSRDHLLEFLECYIDSDVKDVQHGTRSDAVVVAFDDPVGKFNLLNFLLPFSVV